MIMLFKSEKVNKQEQAASYLFISRQTFLAHWERGKEEDRAVHLHTSCLMFDTCMYQVWFFQAATKCSDQWNQFNQPKQQTV